MSKRIPYQEVYRDLDGVPARVQARDNDGELEWEIKPDVMAAPGPARLGKPKMKVANTYDLLLEVCRTLQNIKALYRQDDERRATGIFVQVEAAEDRAHHQAQVQEGAPPPANDLRDVILGNKSYDWLHGVLLREYAPTLNVEAAVVKERGDKPFPFRFALWGDSGLKFQNELRDPGDRDLVDIKALGLED